MILNVIMSPNSSPIRIRVRLIWSGFRWTLRAAAITFGRTVWTKIPHPVDTLIRHELIHVEQYRRYGFWTFLWRYATQHKFRVAMENEAYMGANDMWPQWDAA